jgi:GNAT superfamily N-acetyltransferase
MTGIELQLEEHPDPADLRMLEDGLRDHGLRFTAGVPGFQPLGVFARGADGRVLGGAFGQVNWTWLFVSMLWVAAEMRGRGLGAELLRALERAAHARGCLRVHLDTFSYQARPFYERLGYRVFATLDEYPPGHRRFFLEKAICIDP